MLLAPLSSAFSLLSRLLLLLFFYDKKIFLSLCSFTTPSYFILVLSLLLLFALIFVNFSSFDFMKILFINACF